MGMFTRSRAKDTGVAPEVVPLPPSRRGKKKTLEVGLPPTTPQHSPPLQQRSPHSGQKKKPSEDLPQSPPRIIQSAALPLCDVCSPAAPPFPPIAPPLPPPSALVQVTPSTCSGHQRLHHRNSPEPPATTTPQQSPPPPQRSPPSRKKNKAPETLPPQPPPSHCAAPPPLLPPPSTPAALVQVTPFTQSSMHALSRKARASVTAMQTESHQLSAIITTQTTRPSPESPDLPPPLPPPSLPPLTPLSAPDLHDPLNSAKNHTSSMNHSPRCQDRSSEAPNMPPSDGMASKEVDKHSKSNCRIRFKNSLLSSSFFSRRNKQLNLVQQSKEHENSNPTLRHPEGSVMLKTNTAKVTAFTNCSTEPTYADAATPPPKDPETLNELVMRPLNPSSLMMETLRRRYKEQIDTAQTVAENDVPREQLGIRRKTMPEQLPGKPMTPSPADDLNNDTDATPTPITEKSTGAEESIDKDVEFHDCESPTRGAALETPLPPIPVDIADEIQRGSAITFCDGINGEVFENIIGAIKPETEFPITSNDIIQSLSHIKNGATCTIAWTFDRQTKINISEGVVTKTNRRANKKKITLRYRGIKGHHASEYFDGFLPPQENVRIFHLRWHITPPELDESDEQSHEDTTFNYKYTFRNLG